MTGTERIQAERQRQIEKEGWTPKHDDEHADGSLLFAAICYALPKNRRGRKIVREEAPSEYTMQKEFIVPRLWPESWSATWWKPSEDTMRNLEKAGALIAAEIDRLARARR